MLCLVIALLCASTVSGITPYILGENSAVLRGNSAVCGQSDPSYDDLLMEAIQQVHQQLGPPGCNPPRNRSCQEILYCFPSASSDYYQIYAANGSLVPVYCNMEGTNCGNTTGWTRVAYLNMTQPGATCPQALVQKNTSGLDLCYRPEGSGCYATIYSTLGLSYSQVCGQLQAYQYGTPDAFYSFVIYNKTTIDSIYVDGVSVTYGSPRKHIWTYAGGATQDDKAEDECPCNTGNIKSQVPPFVGNDYYCESASNVIRNSNTLFSDDPLWDGQQCTNLEGPCCTHPNMPWFAKVLNETTTESIELRSCFNRAEFEDTPLQIVELYVH